MPARGNALGMVAFDLGASNGRAMLGRFDGHRLIVEETARFVNEPLKIGGHWCWDSSRLLSDIKGGLVQTSLRCRGQLQSMGIDSWGVDYGLLDTSDNLMGSPRHYRDEQTAGMREAAFARMPREVLYRETGNAFERYNTLFQVLGMIAEGTGTLEAATSLLLMADLFVFLLTGTKESEFTAATTTQLMKAGSRQWSQPVLEAMGIPEGLFSPITLPGRIRGALRTKIAAELGLGPLPVVAVGHHDTASAVAGIPAFGHGHAFLSSGTWSLLGMVVPKPVLTMQAMELGYTNEGCVDGGYRLLKSITGLWILQECKRSWDEAGAAIGFGDLSELAEEAAPFVGFIDPGNEVFFSPGDMPQRVTQFCKRTGQPVPDSTAAMVRCLLESLALKYRQAVEDLEAVSGISVATLHIVGGGSRNRVLNQFTANSINRPVVAGPEESATFGNLIMQAVALGAIRDAQEGRTVIGDSVRTEQYSPVHHQAWDDAYARFRRICDLQDKANQELTSDG